MANNQYVNKVEFAGQTLMDLTGDTVDPTKVLDGETFHDRSGTPQQGSMITHDVYDGLDSTSTDDALSANQGKVLNEQIVSLKNKLPWTRVAMTNGQASISFNLGECDEVMLRVQDTSGTTYRNATIVLPSEALSNVDQVFYIGGFISSSVGFGVAINATKTSANLVAVGANGTRQSPVPVTVYLVIYKR